MTADTTTTAPVPSATPVPSANLFAASAPTIVTSATRKPNKRRSGPKANRVPRSDRPRQAVVPTVDELRERFNAFDEAGGLEYVDGWVLEELKGGLSDDAPENERFGFNRALTIGEAKLHAGQIQSRCAALLALGDDTLGALIGRGWPFRTIHDPNANQADRERAVGIAEKRILEAPEPSARRNELETTRSMLWAEHGHVLTAQECRSRWARIMSAESRLYADDAELDDLEWAIKEMQKLVRELSQPIGRRRAGRRGNEAARALKRQQNEALLKVKGKK